ncbi:MAG: type II toxin-antitoxin system VapC family toxin [Proteobacteria bacterium]|nr:type II toxin-antitoxin system VapC family toxin [Pseudomonadota bacterium]
MAKVINPFIFNNFIDGMLLNDGEDKFSLIEEIKERFKSSDIDFMLPYSVKAEIEHPNTPSYIRDRAANFLYTVPVNLVGHEREFLAKITKIIQGNAKSGRHERDAYHLFECDKYGGGYFLTQDSRLLRKADEIGGSGLIELLVISPRDFLAKLEQFSPCN